MGFAGSLPWSGFSVHASNCPVPERIEKVVAPNVRFSNRPVGVKHFQAIRHCSVNVARRLALLYGIGTEAVPPWDSKTRRRGIATINLLHLAARGGERHEGLVSSMEWDVKRQLSFI